jgi:uncharacterized membrane protein
VTQFAIGGLVVMIGFLFAGRWFIRWYLGLDRLELLLLDCAVSLRTLPSVREYDKHLDRLPPKAA